VNQVHIKRAFGMTVCRYSW